MTVLPLVSRFRQGRPGPHVAVRLTGRASVGEAALRPLTDGEVAPLLAVFDGLSVDSRTSRYFVPVPRLPSAMIEALARVDGHHQVAWLASVSGQPAGIARYVRVGPATAEIAFEVVDRHQTRGLGTALLDAITTAACVNGISRVRVTVLPSNEPSRRLIARLGIPLVHDDGVLEGEGRLRLLDPSVVDRAAVAALTTRAYQVTGGQVGGCSAPPGSAQ